MPATIAVYGKANVQQWDKAIKKAQELRGEAAKSASGTGGAFSKLGGVISSTGAKIASGLAAAGVATWLKASIDVAKRAEVTQAALKNAVMSTNGTVDRSVQLNEDAAKATFDWTKKQLAAHSATRAVASALKSHGRDSQQYRDAVVRASIAEARLADATDTRAAAMDAAKHPITTTNIAWADYQKRLDRVVASASAVSAYSKGELKGALTQLVTTTGNANASLGMLGTVQDLARRKGMSLEQASVLVGKAYNGNITALKKLGIELPKGTKGMAAVDAIQKRVAGSAKAYGDSAAGAQDKFRNTLTELQKTVGATLLPVLNKLMSWANSMLQGFGSLNPGVQQFIVGMAAVVAAGLMLAPWVANIIAIVNAVKAWEIATKLQAAGQWLLNAAMNANPIGLVVLAVVALVAVLAIAWTKSATFRNAIIGCWNAVKNAAAAMWAGIVAGFSAAIAWLGGAWDAIKGAAVAVWTWLVAAFRKYGLWVLAAITGPIGLLVLAIAKHWTQIKAGAVAAWNGLIAYLKAAPGNIVRNFTNAARLLWSVGTNIVTGLWNGVRAQWHTLTTNVGNLFTGLVTWIKKLLGIHSPSTVAHEMGSYFGEGFANGITAKVAAVRSAASRLADAASVSASATISTSYAGSGGGLAAAGVGGVSSRSVTIAPGAVQLTFPGGTSATPADVDASVRRAFRQLADEIRRR